jgi:hypothetical protein
MKEYGMFCEVFGKTNRNLVLEHMLVHNALEFAVPDMASELGISKPKAYSFVEEFIKLDYLKATRKIGSVQLYILNASNPKVKILLKAFTECLRLVIDSYPEIKNEFDRQIVIFQNRRYELVELTDKRMEQIREVYKKNQKTLTEQKKK